MKQHNHLINRWRVREGLYGTTNRAGNNGAFRIPGRDGKKFLVIASDGMGWEHVSVSITDESRCPTWDEMCFIKDIFWHEEEVAIQFHPARSQYVTCHPYVLHIWKPIGVFIPVPPPILVGPLGVEVQP